MHPDLPPTLPLSETLPVIRTLIVDAEAIMTSLGRGAPPFPLYATLPMV